MEIGQLLLYSVMVGAFGSLMNGDRFGQFKPFVLFAGICLIAGLVLRAIGLGTSMLAAVMTAIFVSQIVFTMWTHK